MTNTNSPSPIDDKGYIALSAIKADKTFRCRMRENRKTVEEYTEVFRDYQNENSEYPFPPVVIWEKKGKYYLIAGYHRYFAAEKAGLDKIRAKVFQGTKEEALIFAIQDNR